MVKTDDHSILAALPLALADIEIKLGWGPSEHWTTNDFDRLGELIEEATATRLSSTTLKRLWGRVRYTSQPNPHTLDTLARYLGHAHWRAFQRQKRVVGKEKEVEKKPPTAAARLVFPKKYILALGLLLAVGWAGWMWWKVPAKAVSPSIDVSGAVQFTVTKIARGLPNTVVFRYDVGDLVYDSLFLQQDWDASRRQLLPTSRGETTTIYTYPGYFRAKLVADGQILREYDLYITTDGWMGAIETEPIPRYLLPRELLTTGGSLRLAEAVYDEIDAQHPLFLTYAYLTDWPDLKGDDVRLRTRLRHTLYTGGNICQFTRVLLIGTEGVVSVPLSRPGCAGQLRLFLNDERVDGSTRDLSPFGVELSEWRDLGIDIQGKEVWVTLDDREIFRHRLKRSMGRIVGLRYRFAGAGEVASARLSNHAGRVFLDENFDTVR